ncbi:SDR family oxidoreductase [Rhodoplanes sp. Z2-YC6860]|uniref:SDR family oxidoreductase n=1 Tax=Rhodoplanes sp. Z2-YC6860 TaxID=674703 RepID=UPI00078B82CD|nr:SDR family oxidoreductase [Rhodoplanes sp. Z2-YC6860]AMN42238.1 short-chain oxidoreductase [Rhodoplanes sp. Z2-YC6860]
MQIEGSVALVTGTNRGLGKAYAMALLAAGAAKVYAAARDPSAVTDPRLVPVRLDVTKPDEIAAAAAHCGDVNLLINNAGVMHSSPMMTEGSEVAMRAEMEVNVYGVLGMIRAFAPVLKRNGGGAIVNVLSVVSWFTLPFNATYGASKRAALAVTESARIELKAQRTRVLSVHAGYIDTDMAADISQPKTSPQQVAARTLEALRSGNDLVLADDRAQHVWQATRADPFGFAESMQKLWDERQPK